MTDSTKNEIISYVRSIRRVFDKRATNPTLHPEDRSAYHGAARSLKKIERRAEKKVAKG